MMTMAEGEEENKNAVLVLMVNIPQAQGITAMGCCPPPQPGGDINGGPGLCRQ